MMTTDNNVHDMVTLKKCKIIAKDLDRVIRFYDLSIAGLSGYSKYIPVADTLAKLKNEKAKLVIYHNKCVAIIKVKGLLKG